MLKEKKTYTNDNKDYNQLKLNFEKQAYEFNKLRGEHQLMLRKNNAGINKGLEFDRLTDEVKELKGKIL